MEAEAIQRPLTPKTGGRFPWGHQYSNFAPANQLGLSLDF
jgi:hypothetical protein